VELPAGILTTLTVAPGAGPRHPPDSWQQVGGQFTLADKTIRASGHRRLPVGVALQQAQGDDAHPRQRLPQASDGLQAGAVQAD